MKHGRSVGAALVAAIAIIEFACSSAAPVAPRTSPTPHPSLANPKITVVRGVKPRRVPGTTDQYYMPDGEIVTAPSPH